MSTPKNHHSFNDDAKRILIVDDNLAIHDDFRRILSPTSSTDQFDEENAAFFGSETTSKNNIHFQLEFAAQGNEALNKVHNAIQNGYHYAVVFMDIRMPPGWDGVETAQHLWKADPDLQIVICTAYSDYSWDQLIEKLGHTDQLLILRKPFDIIEAEQAAHALSRKWALLQESRRHAIFLEQTMDLSPSMIFWISENGSITYINQSAKKLLQRDSENPINMHIGDVFTNWNDAAWHEISNKVHIQKNLTIETFVTTDSGANIPVEAIITFLDFQSNRTICISAQDIRARIKTLRELATARDAALESARMKSQFLATMSHEIRTPMNGVLGMTELLSQTPLSPSQKEYVGIIDQSGMSLLSIINDILDSAKIESGKLDLQHIGFNLPEIAKGVIQTISHNAEKKQLKLTHHIDKNIPTHLLGDPGRLRQVLLNLVGNAVKFTPQGEVSLNINLITISNDACLLKFSIKDTGIGIEPKSLARIFHPFTQVDNTDTRSYGGTGLGLTISSQIVQAMGGTIDVLSEAGKGSEFSFCVSFMKASTQDKIHLTSHHPNEHSIKSTSNTVHSMSSYEGDSHLKILLAEDNEVNCKVTLLQLQKIGHTADIAENGEEVLKALDKKAYDVILMDCQMPVMDGFKATREIRRRHRRPIRIIALTANAMKDDRERCLKAGMDDYLSKPLRSEDLAAALGSFTPAIPSPQTPPSSCSTPVDLDRLHEITDNDKEFAKQLIQDYITQADEILTDMESVIHAGNFEDMRRLAHKLAGSSASCGMNAVVPTLREIEALSMSNSTQALPLYEETVRQLKEIREFLATHSI